MRRAPERAWALTFVFAASLALLSIPAPLLPAQSPIPIAAPSRADSLLALGRLAMAEEELYAAVGARPRSPTARGALGAYLASRGRFRIAEILLEEAMRFGADTISVRRAIARMAPWRLNGAIGAGETTVGFRVIADGPVLGTVLLRTALNGEGGEGREVWAGLDLRVSGVVVGGRSSVGRRGMTWRSDVRIGERVIPGVLVSRDTLLAADSVRVGLDVLWGLHPLIDERAGTLTLGRAATMARTPAPYVVPIVIGFPGLTLVPRPGVAPIALGSRAGRTMLRGRRWHVDEANAVIVVDR
jgi:hypothetical protein